MRPLSIELHAFGPFATSERVDFEALGERTFFLIHGPTGAGKTTLLDAICFALYGHTSGGERDARAMRSDHADDATITRVVFEFALGPLRYRIDRAPAQTRKKVRGEGHMTAKAEAQLDLWTDGAWKSIDSQPGKVSARAEQLLGFSSEQFRQVVVLPQGRFREVLTADSASREAILEHLFSTELFRRIEETLRAEALSIERESRDLEMQTQGLLGSAQLASEEELDVRHAALVAAHDELSRRVETTKTDEAGARAAHASARDVMTNLAEAAAAERDAAIVDAEALGMEAARAKVGAARRALQVHPADVAWREASEAVTEASRRVAATRDLASEAEIRLVAARRGLEVETARAQARTESAERLARLDSLGPKLRAADALRTTRTALAQKRDEAARARDGASAAIIHDRRQLEAERARLQRIRDEAAPLEALLLKQRQAQETARRVEALHADTVALARSTDALTSLLGTVDEAEKSLVWLEAQLVSAEADHRAAHATRLAASLHEGEPCPVCGSETHPRPARAQLELLGQGPLETAQENVRARRVVLARATEAAQLQRLGHAALTARVDQRRDELGADEPSPDTTRDELMQLANAVARAESARAQLVPLEATCTKLERSIEAAHDALDALDADQTRRELELARLDGELHALLDEVPLELRELEALRVATAAARVERDRLERALRDAVEAEAEASRASAVKRAQHDGETEAHARLDATRGRRRTQYDQTLAQAGFADETSYAAATLPLDALTTLERALAEHETRRSAAHDRRTRAREAARDLEPIDVAAAAARVEAATLEVERAVAERETAAARLAALDELRASLRIMSARRGEAASRYAVLGRLSEVANGDNPRRLSFQRFVLVSLLDEVLEAASVRLRRMSKNRFELLRVTEQLDQRVAGGLDIDVFDHHTGTRRPGNTLSGGEGFLASLSLALGLADIVQARAGGIQLETLFVDEGFGSLDPESLDFAIRTLMDLQQAGRMVGIISHVAELEERIDVRLEVKATARGSTVVLHLP